MVTMMNDGSFEIDKITLEQGELIITFLGHASLMMSWQGKIIYIDPIFECADYTKLPKADLILATHDHYDHFDPEAIDTIKTEQTTMVVTQDVAKQIKEGIVMKNGDKKTILEMEIEAVPAYNVVNMRSPRVPYHAPGTGNGYIVTCGSKRVYIAGDTENIPEMKELKDIDIAFLPMNLPYTMTPQMVADAACSFQPKILYPYHYGETNVQELIDLLENENIEVRIRKMM